MGKFIKQNIELVLALVAISIFVIIHLNPPTDYDGGPMMAYNFLFYLPLKLLSVLLALISTIIAMKRLRKKGKNQVLVKKVALGLSLFILVDFCLLLFSIVYYNLAEEVTLIPDPVYSKKDFITLQSKDTIHLTAYNWGENLEKRKLYFSQEEFGSINFSFQESICFQGDENLEVFYIPEKDTLLLLAPDGSHIYEYYKAERVDQIPLKKLKLTIEQFDSIQVAEKNRIQSFNWK